MFLSNCKVSILRGTVTDAFGDSKDRDDPVHTGIPASIMEVRSGTTVFADGMPRQVRYLIGRLPPGTDIRSQDRLLDERTGEKFMVDAIDLQARSPVMNSGIRLDLRRVT